MKDFTEIGILHWRSPISGNCHGREIVL